MTSCNDSGAAQHAISIPQGSDWSEDYQLVDPGGIPVDCTGWTGEAILRLSATESYNFTVTTLDALLGEYRVSMDDSVTFVTTNIFGMFGGVIAHAGSGFLEAGNNLSDLTDVAQARVNLGITVTLALDTDGVPYFVEA